MQKPPLRAALSCLWLLAAVGAAHAAADPMRIAAMLTAAAAATGDVEITYDKVTAKGDDITLSNVKVTTGNDTATFAAMIITGAVERPGGGFTAKHIAFDNGMAIVTASVAPKAPEPAAPANKTTGTATPAAPATPAKPGTATATTGTATTPATPAKPGTTTATTGTAATPATPAKPGTTPATTGTATTAATPAKPGTTTATTGTATTPATPAKPGTTPATTGTATAAATAAKPATTTSAAAPAEAPKVEGESKWATASVDNVIVPSPAEIMAHAKIRPFQTLTMGGLSVAQGANATPITVATVNVTVSDVSDTMPAAIHLAATGAKIPAAFIGNPIANAMIVRMGYTEFDADITMDSVYDTAKNSVAVNALLINAAQVGKIAISAQMSDTSLGGIADPTQATDARAASRLDSFSIRFDDAGFVGRMLDMQANLVGGTRSDVVDGLVYGALPFVLNYISNTAFRSQFQDAAATFLANPKNITITATPTTPVPLGEVMRTAVSDPLKLPDLLMPQVVANK